jgi:hypothetical protein
LPVSSLTPPNYVPLAIDGDRGDDNMAQMLVLIRELPMNTTTLCCRRPALREAATGGGQER